MRTRERVATTTESLCLPLSHREGGGAKKVIPGGLLVAIAVEISFYALSCISN